MLRHINQLRYGYEQDMDERARQVALLGLRDGLVAAFVFALAIPILAPLPFMSFLWPGMPMITIIFGLFISQVSRVARGGVTRRVALLGGVSVGVLILIALGIQQLIFALMK